MNKHAVVMIALSVFFASGCTAHHVKYTPFVRYRIKPAAQATAVYGVFDEAKTLFEKSLLPHYSLREKYELRNLGLSKLTQQLGGEDYILIGEVYGSGNARTTLETLKAAFCRRAAKEGGDVVMVFRSGIEERPFVYTTPGYATTNVNGSAYCSGNHAYGNATGHTTYYPGQTYTGTLCLPYGNGLVFKYMPGAGKRRRIIAGLDDGSFVRVLQVFQTTNDESFELEQVLEKIDQEIKRQTPTNRQ